MLLLCIAMLCVHVMLPLYVVRLMGSTNLYLKILDDILTHSDIIECKTSRFSLFLIFILS